MRNWFEPTLGRVKLATYLAPPLLIGAVEFARQLLVPDLFESRWLYAIFLATLLGSMFAFAWAIGRQVERMQDHLRYQNQELLALHHSSMAIAGDLHLKTVLRRVVDEAATLVGARYGAISFSQDDPRIESFVTHGVDPSLQDDVGRHPIGLGLLGVPVQTGTPVRIPDVRLDPRAVGFPEGHPHMSRLLGVPVGRGEAVIGTLYLADKHDGTQFSPSDEGTLVRFASLAAIAIENAVLHEQVQALAIGEERERIAREMHDSLAQVLAYVNTKSQAALRHLEANDPDRCREQIEQLAQTAREAYVDVREGILALRIAARTSDADVFDTIAAYARRWQEQSGIEVETLRPEASGVAVLAPLAEMHLIRLVQEALTNIRKHAQAERVRITMSMTGDALTVSVEDDGAGFEPGGRTPGIFPRFGLSTMRERAEASGGTFALESTPGQGTRVDATLPLAPRPD